MKRYKPSVRALPETLAYDLSPATLGVLGALLLRHRAGWLILVPSAVMVMMTVFCLVVTMHAFLSSVTVADDRLVFHRPWSRLTVAWGSVLAATIRERHNKVTRTDRMLVLQLANGEMVTYATSVLSPEDEAEFLEMVRARVRAATVRDRPSI